MISFRNLSWQQVAVIVACLGCVFAAHKFLGEDAGMVSGFVTTVFAFLMGRNGGDPPANGGNGPNLTVIKGGGGMAAGLLFLLFFLPGCASLSGTEIEKAAAGADVSAKLNKCRGDARADYYVAGRSVEESLATYDECLKREGLKR